MKSAVSTVSRLAVSLALLAAPTACAAAGGADIRDIAYGLITAFQPVWTIVATIAIIAAGFSLVLSQDEGRLQRIRGILSAIIIGGITVTLVSALGPTLIGYVYNGLGTFQGDAAGLGLEAEGVAGWIMSLSAISGIIMVILSMIEAVASVGSNDDGYRKLRTAVIHVVMGLMIIIGAGVIRSVFYVTHEPSPLLRYIAGKINLVLAFILFIAIAILIYAGFRMVISVGREEDFNAAKSLALRVIVGILIITLSLSLVAIVTALLSN